MKKTFLLSIAALVSAAVIIAGCKKDDSNPEPTPEPIPDVPKIFYDSSGVSSLFNKVSLYIVNPFLSSPKAGATDCRCFVKPLTLVFETPLNSEMEVKVLDTLSYKYRFELTGYSVVDASGDNVAETITLYNNNHQADITHKELKPGNEYTLTISATLKQYVNGDWMPVSYGGKELKKTDSYNFTTANLLENTIEPENIIYQYPVDRQYNYMPDEYKYGYIMLNNSYSNLFAGLSDSDKSVVIKAVNDQDFESTSVPFTVKECHNHSEQAIEINYSLENVSFNPDKIYNLQFVAGENTIYQIWFRTSKYPNFKARLANIASDLNGSLFLRDDVPSIILNLDEPFDLAELQHAPMGDLYYYSRCMVVFELDLDNCEWYQNSVFKPMYEFYNKELALCEDRFRVDIKLPPSNAIFLWPKENGGSIVVEHENNKGLTDAEISNGKTEGLIGEKSLLMLCIHNYFYRDYELVLQNPSRQKHPDESVENNLANHLEQDVVFPKGDYPYSISFRLPGKNIITYSEKHLFRYE